MAMAGIYEAIRNLVSVGGRFDRISLLDNFCWGDCKSPQGLGQLVRAAQACYDGAMAFNSPFISGKDSLNNEFQCEDGTRISIPPTLLISAMTVVDNVGRCVTMDAKKPSNLLFIVGETKNELGGSHYYKVNNQLGANVPTVDLQVAPRIASKISEAINRGLVSSCHDCSEGGLAAALAEMAFAGGFGIEADLRGLPKSDDCRRIDAQLFSESNSRFIVEVEPANFDSFAKLMINLPFGQIGKVTAEKILSIKTDAGRQVIKIDLDTLKKSWQKTFDWK